MSGYATLVVMMLITFATLAIFLVQDDEAETSAFEYQNDSRALLVSDELDEDEVLDVEWAGVVAETEPETPEESGQSAQFD